LGPFFLDRYPVTNARFYEFVAAGGYQDAALWDATILPAVLGFVDRTGEPGPRFWSGGCYDPAKKDHPVVGVSWYEAAAYARWAGKRLPTDAEWVKAASWPVPLSLGMRSQRRYPWGDTMDRSRANLWGSGPKGTVPVTAFAGGASVGSVYQLVGNVWEWMRGDFPPADGSQAEWIAETPLKSIRGGAFDTYFDKQATCQFQSGESALARKHNIGFRCAVGVCDLLLARSGDDAAPATLALAVLPEETPV
jgi:iron(II)-dependent oxidoreductase